MQCGQIDALISLIESLGSTKQVTLAMDFVQKLSESDRERAWDACMETMKKVQ